VHENDGAQFSVKLPRVEFSTRSNKDENSTLFLIAIAAELDLAYDWEQDE
jgi:hypothetical protein